jgi:hypothetical protein
VLYVNFLVLCFDLYMVLLLVVLTYLIYPIHCARFVGFLCAFSTCCSVAINLIRVFLTKGLSFWQVSRPVRICKQC